MTRKFFCVTALAVAIVAGCNEGRNLETGSVERSVVAALAPGLQDSIAVTLSVEYPVSGLSAKAMEESTCNIIDLLFASALDSAYALPDSLLSGRDSAGVAAAADAYADLLVRYYRDTNMPFFDEGEPDWAFQWQSSMNGYFVGGYSHYLSYMMDGYSYTGGAHGAGVRIPMVLDSRDGHAVSEEEFFAEDSADSLAALLRSHLREAFETEEDYDMLFIKDIVPNGNYFVTEDGVSYIYGEYEIGPYALGEITVTVPWPEAKPLLR